MWTEGIVLSSTPYKDRDAVVNLLTEEGVRAFYARGINSASSKNRRLCNPHTLVRLQLEGTGMPRLIHGDVVQEFSKVNDDLEKQTVVNVLAEAFGKCAFEADAALRYKRLLESIQSQQADWTARACLCIISFLEAEGILPYVDGCVQCGSTAGIETFSKEKAGFLCGKCSHGRKVWPVIQLRKFRALCKAGVQDDEKLVAAYSFTLKDFVFLADWLMRHAQVRLAGLEFLETVLRLS